MMLRKLHREFTDLKKSEPEYRDFFRTTPKKEKSLQADGSFEEEYNFSLWTAVIYGPVDTPYAGKTFNVVLSFPADYPYNPPVVKFISRIYHPNISLTGDVCIDILKQNWSAALGIEKIMLSIISLLAAPNANDPLNQDAGKLYLENIELFNKKAREF
jgi:ubiquitin-protein ligase